MASAGRLRRRRLCVAARWTRRPPSNLRALAQHLHVQRGRARAVPGQWPEADGYCGSLSVPNDRYVARQLALPGPDPQGRDAVHALGWAAKATPVLTARPGYSFFSQGVFSAVHSVQLCAKAGDLPRRSSVWHAHHCAVCEVCLSLSPQYGTLISACVCLPPPPTKKQKQYPNRKDWKHSRQTVDSLGRCPSLFCGG